MDVRISGFGKTKDGVLVVGATQGAKLLPQAKAADKAKAGTGH